MTIVMIMKWDGVTTAQYDDVRELVGWESNVPHGAQFHVATHDGSALRITDVWDSAEDFDSFVSTRLMPGVEKAGIPGEPQVEVYPLHALFTPGCS